MLQQGFIQAQARLFSRASSPLAARSAYVLTIWPCSGKAGYVLPLFRQLPSLGLSIACGGQEADVPVALKT